MKPEHVVITFNYDATLERVLLEQKKWSFSDGYGFELKFQQSRQDKTIVPPSKSPVCDCSALARRNGLVSHGAERLAGPRSRSCERLGKGNASAAKVAGFRWCKAEKGRRPRLLLQPLLPKSKTGGESRTINLSNRRNLPGPSKRRGCVRRWTDTRDIL